jgi:hypothetical protein
VASSVLDPPRDHLAPPDETASARVRTTWALALVVVLGVALRAWRLGFNGLTFDESFTAMAARLPLDRLFEHLRTQDTHPPLDYLLRGPLARAGAPDALLRAPSLVFSVGALVLFAWWMRHRGLAGIVATSVFALSMFQIYYGGEARMYALLELLGVAAAVLAERWLRDAPVWCAWAAAALVALALLDHVSGFLLAVGLVAIAGTRTDRRAWEWRAAVAGGIASWAVLWGTSFASQVGGDWAGWIPRTSVSRFARAVSSQVTYTRGVEWLMLASVIAGAWFLGRSDRRLRHVWLALGAVPFVLAAAIGVLSPFFIDRAVTVASWAPPLALGYLAAALVARWRTVGIAFVALLMLVIGATTLTFLRSERYYTDRAIAHLERVVKPGDAILTRPSRYATLPRYRIGVERGHGMREVIARGIDGAAFRAANVPATGRIWLFTPDSFELTFPGYRSCPRTRGWTDGVTHVVCLERANR